MTNFDSDNVVLNSLGNVVVSDKNSSENSIMDSDEEE